MANSQSFNLKRQEDDAKNAHLYKTKSRCFRCIAIPCLIAFTLLLILVNVDYDGDAYLTTPRPPLIRTSRTAPPMVETSTVTDLNPIINRPPCDITTTTTTTTTSTSTSSTTRKSQTSTTTTTTTTTMMTTTGRLPRPNRLSASRSYAQSLYCYDEDNNDCNITCNGNVSDVAKTLVLQQMKCRTQLNVFLRQCNFPNGEMPSDFWMGNFRLRSLSIDDCNLEEIANGAFEKTSVNGLNRLVLENVRLSTLNNRTFLGLKSITYFKLTNIRRLQQFHGGSFLTSMAASLQESRVLQESGKLAYDPYDWLGGDASFMQLLCLNLSGNNFKDTLTKRTFENLIQIETLVLSHCQIKAIATHTFDHIAESLIYLDLSYNELTVLDWSFLERSELFQQPLHLILAGNAWRCDCSNYELIEALQSNDVLNGPSDAVCATPPEWVDVNIANVFLQCEGSTPISSNSKQTESDFSQETDEIYASTIETSVAMSHNTDMPLTEDDTTKDITETLISTVPTTLPYETTDIIGTTRIESTDIATTTAKPDNLVGLLCTILHPPHDHMLTVRSYDILFTITTISPTSVIVIVQNKVDINLDLVYFTPNGSISNSRVVGVGLRERIQWCEFRRIITTMISIEELETDSSYVFCMMPNDEQRTSVFNCRSHYLDGSPEIWLYESDKALYSSLFSIALLIFLVIGGSCMYLTLRHRPTWVRGCKRLRRVTELSSLVYLLPKHDDKVRDEEQPYACSGKDVFCTRESIEINTVETIPCTRNSLSPTRSLRLVTPPCPASDVDQRPPLEPAPAVPVSINVQPVPFQRNRIASVAEEREQEERAEKEYLKERQEKEKTVAEIREEQHPFHNGVFYEELL